MRSLSGANRLVFDASWVFIMLVCESVVRTHHVWLSNVCVGMDGSKIARGVHATRGWCVGWISIIGVFMLSGRCVNVQACAGECSRGCWL